MDVDETIPIYTHVPVYGKVNCKDETSYEGRQAVDLTQLAATRTVQKQAENTS